MNFNIADEMMKARKLAENAALRGEVPVGALVLSADGIVLGEGSNSRESEQSALGHAELMAIQGACKKLGSWRLEGCLMIVTLEPCLMCLGAIQQSRIAKVYYGARDLKMGALSLGCLLHQDPRTNHRFECEFVDDAESGRMLTEFFSKRRAEKKSVRDIGDDN